jgi:PTS system nitrogen regulatory IIA component
MSPEGGRGDPVSGGGLAELLRRGGFFYEVPGATPQDVLGWLVSAVKLPGHVDREKLLSAVLEREDLLSTAVGNGIALPHPRNPIIEKEEDQCAVLGFLENEVDWDALDGKTVTAVVLVVSSSARSHLTALQRITFFCRDGGFCGLLKRRAPPEEILAYIEKAEAAW